MLRVPVWRFVALAGTWGGLVIGAHVVALPVDWSAAPGHAATVFAAVSDLTADVLGGHLVALGCALLIVAAATTLGHGLLALLRVRDLSAGERLLYGAALGLGALSSLMLPLMALGWTSRGGTWIGLAALAAVGVAGGLRGLRGLRGLFGVRGGGRQRAAVGADQPPRRGRRPLLDRIALGALVLHAGVTLVGALAPLTFYDSLAYHVSAPHLSLLDGRLVPMPENLLARMPAAAGSLGAYALILQGEVGAKLLCWVCGVLVAAAIGLFARRMAWTGAGLWGALVFASMFPVAQASIAGGIDLLLTLFAVCSVSTFLLWTEADRLPERRAGAFPMLVLSAVFSGFAMGTKYTAVLVPVALIGGLFLSTCRSRADALRCVRASLWLVLISGLVFAPWMVRNVALYGNPVAPFLAEVFTPHDADQIEALAAFTAEAAQRHMHSPWDLLALPWGLSVGSVPNSVGFSPLFLAMLPLLFLFRGYPRRLRLAALVAALFALGWIQTSTAVRYLMPVLPWPCLLLAYWALHARLGVALRRAVQLSILACCLVGVIGFGTVLAEQGSWRVVLGVQTRDDYLSRSQDGYHNPPYALYRWIDGHLPASARVLLLGETRGVYLDRGFVAGSVFDRNPLVRWAERCEGPAQLAALLTGQGITHLLVNPMEALRLRPYGMLRTTTEASHTLRLFWRRHVRELVSVAELSGETEVNRLSLYVLTTPTDGEALQPDHIGRLLETP